MLGRGGGDRCRPDPEKITTKFHLDPGHAAAQQLKSVSVVSDRGEMHVAKYVDGALKHCEVCRAFDEPLQVPVAGTLSMSNAKLQVRPEGVAFYESSLKLLPLDPRESKKPSRSQRRFPQCLAALGGPRVFR